MASVFGPVASLDTAKTLVNAIQALQVPPLTLASMNAHMRVTEGVDPDWSIYSDPTDQFLGFWGGRYGDRLVCVIRGLSSLPQAAECAAGYAVSFVSLEEPGVNPWYTLNARQIVSSLRQGRRSTIRRVVLAGHSAGGAVAWNMGRAFRERIDISDVEYTISCLSFGSPKPAATDGVCGTLDALNRFVDSRAYFNPLDPVPYAPPSGAGGVTLLPVGITQMAHARSFAVFSRGVEVTAAGVVTPRQSPSGITPQVVQNFARWLLDLDSGNGRPHSIDSYQSSIVAAAAIRPVDVPPMPLAAPPAPLPPPLPVAAARQQAVAQAQLLLRTEQAREANPTARNIVRSWTFARTSPSGVKPRVYGVYLDGVQVMETTRRRTAKACCRSGNRLASDMATVPNVSQSALAEQFAGVVAGVVA